MRALANRPFWLATFSCCALAFSSCSEGDAPQAAADGAGTPTQVSAPSKPVVPPSVSIGEALPVLELGTQGSKMTASKAPGNVTAEAGKAAIADADDDSDVIVEQLAEPELGTPEWLIRKITTLESAPFDAVQQPVPGKPGEFEIVELTAEQVEDEEVRRAEQVVQLALEVVAKTKDDKQRALLFNNAIHYLANSRVTLAAYGDHDQIRLLSDEAEVLYQRDPRSFGAIELQLKLVECLAELAEQDGRKKADWGVMAERQARLFASRFPQDSNRCALALVSAARACEVCGKFDEARQCFKLLDRDFSNTPFAEQAAGAVRRYKLAGQPIGEFAGATIDGGFVSIDQFAGRPVLIVFWSSESPSFREDLPRLKELIRRQSGSSLAVIGVNMDLDESAADSFLEQSELTWRTIFFSNLEQRGVRSPLARAFGVTTVPQYWLIDANGVVVAAPVDLAALETRFSQLAARPGTAAVR